MCWVRKKVVTTCGRGKSQGSATISACLSLMTLGNRKVKGVPLKPYRTLEVKSGRSLHLSCTLSPFKYLKAKGATLKVSPNVKLKGAGGVNLTLRRKR